MNLLEDFQNVIEPFKRPLAILTVVGSAFSLSACANNGFAIPDGSIGNIPVGRILGKSLKRDAYEVQKGIGGAMLGGTRLTNCHNGSGVVVGDPRQCDDRQNQQNGPNNDGVQRLPSRDR